MVLPNSVSVNIRVLLNSEISNHAFYTQIEKVIWNIPPNTILNIDSEAPYQSNILVPHLETPIHFYGQVQVSDSSSNIIFGTNHIDSSHNIITNPNLISISTNLEWDETLAQSIEELIPHDDNFIVIHSDKTIQRHNYNDGSEK